MTLLTADSFNRPNNTTSLGRTDGSGVLDQPNGALWTAFVGTWGVNTNQAYTPTPAGAHSLAGYDLTMADVDMSLTVPIRSGANGAGLFFRYTSSANFWYLRQSSAGNTQLVRVISGSEVVVATTTGAADGQTIRAVLLGSTITCYRNGSLLYGGPTSDTFNQGATIAGLENESATNRLSNWSVTALATVSSPLSSLRDVRSLSYSSGQLVGVS